MLFSTQIKFTKSRSNAYSCKSGLLMHVRTVVFRHWKNTQTPSYTSLTLLMPYTLYPNTRARLLLKLVHRTACIDVRMNVRKILAQIVDFFQSFLPFIMHVWPPKLTWSLCRRQPGQWIPVTWRTTSARISHIAFAYFIYYFCVQYWVTLAHPVSLMMPTHIHVQRKTYNYVHSSLQVVDGAVNHDHDYLVLLLILRNRLHHISTHLY